MLQQHVHLEAAKLNLRTVRPTNIQATIQKL